jgi:hypothetical protein
VRPIKSCKSIEQNKMRSSFSRTIVASSILGWMVLLLAYFVAGGICRLIGGSQNWGELGFVATSILYSLFLSVSYIFLVFALFIPLQRLLRRNKFCRRVWKQAVFGGIIWGLAVTIVSLILYESVMGGPDWNFVSALFDLCSREAIVWLIASLISGAVMFGVCGRASAEAAVTL